MLTCKLKDTPAPCLGQTGGISVYMPVGSSGPASLALGRLPVRHLGKRWDASLVLDIVGIVLRWRDLEKAKPS